LTLIDCQWVFVWVDGCAADLSTVQPLLDQSTANEYQRS